MPNLERTATGYSLVMPPGWDRIPLRSQTQDAIKRIVDHAVTYVDPATPRDHITRARLDLHNRLNRSAEDARRQNGIDMYIPVEKIHGVLLPASILVSKVVPGFAHHMTPSETMSHLTKDFGASEDIKVDGVDGVRCQRHVPRNPKEEESAPSLQVNYVAPVPDSSGVTEWIVVCFTLVVHEDLPAEFSEVFVELFDAAMTTFRWSVE